LRQDSFQADNVFAFGYKACVQLSQNAIAGQVPGSPTAIHFGNLNCDAVKYAIWVDPTSVGAVAAVDHLWVGGETCCTTVAPIPGSNAIQIDGQDATVDINDIHLTAVDQSAINITNPISGSIVRLGSIDASNGMNYGDGVAFAGRSPVVNAAVAGKNPSQISILHPLQPRNAGYATGGSSPGIINPNSNAILYTNAQSRFK
jgi:hypothetical protein